jgi:hypothetical protein
MDLKNQEFKFAFCRSHARQLWYFLFLPEQNLCSTPKRLSALCVMVGFHVQIAKQEAVLHAVNTEQEFDVASSSDEVLINY